VRRSAIQPAQTLGVAAASADRISFGTVKDLTEFPFHTTETDDLEDEFLYEKGGRWMR